ncbi:MAG: oligosaccharide flippase family protein [Sulfurimonas sp.]|jgi:O-antigen/teichoic acid export membrane protein
MKFLKPKSEFSRNVLTLMTGTTIAQAIPIAISPILTRIYTPEDFGVFALYVAIASILSVVATGRYEMAIMLPKKDEDAINIVALSIAISFFVSFISFLIVFIFNTQITELLGNQEISNWLYFIPVTVLLTGIYQSFNYWFNRNKDYQELSKNKVYQSSTTVGVKLASGVWNFGAMGLIFGTLSGHMLAVILLIKKYFTKNKKYKISYHKMVAISKRYKDFPKHSMPTAFLDVISMNTPAYMLSKFFSIQTLGYYSVAYQMLQMPSALIANAFSQVFYQKFNELSGKPTEQISFILNIWKKLFFIGFIPFTTIFLFGEDIFAFVFGSKWIEAGKIASYLSIMIFFMFISSPTSSAFTVLRMQKIGLYFGLAVLIYRPLAFFIGYYFADFWFGLKILVIIELLQIGLYNYFIVKKIRGLK